MVQGRARIGHIEQTHVLQKWALWYEVEAAQLLRRSGFFFSLYATHSQHTTMRFCPSTAPKPAMSLALSWENPPFVQERCDAMLLVQDMASLVIPRDNDITALDKFTIC